MNGEDYREEIRAIRMFNCDPNPQECLCGGCGWFLTDFDTWEKCHLHYLNGKDTPHTEDAMDALDALDFAI
jgi:hypothetical protein